MHALRVKEKPLSHRLSMLVVPPPSSSPVNGQETGVDGTRLLNCCLLSSILGFLLPAKFFNLFSYSCIYRLLLLLTLCYDIERYIRHRHFRWWSRYGFAIFLVELFVLTAVLGDRFNYVTSAALDGGTTIALLVIFLTVQIHQSQGLQWWGNLINSKSEYLDLFFLWVVYVACWVPPSFGSRFSPSPPSIIFMCSPLWLMKARPGGDPPYPDPFPS
jgi:hypothetical protein